MPAKKKRRSRKQSTEPPWFEQSSGNQLFIWRCRPHHSSRSLLLTGNAKGYQNLMKQLNSLNSQKQFVDIQLTIPQLGPPIQWAPSSLGKKAVASIQEIESDFRKHVVGFSSFVWYRHFKLVLEDDLYQPQSELVGDRIKVTLSLPHAEDWIDRFSQVTFPAWGGQCLASGNPDLWLSGDWLGAE